MSQQVNRKRFYGLEHSHGWESEALSSNCCCTCSREALLRSRPSNYKFNCSQVENIPLPADAP